MTTTPPQGMSPIGHTGGPAAAPRFWVKADEPVGRLRNLADASRAIAGVETLDQLLEVVTEAARGLIAAHQAVTSRLHHGWSDAATYVSLSDKYAEFRDYDLSPQGLGVLNFVTRENLPLRLTSDELAAHPEFRGLADAPGHPPLPDYLAAPLISRSGRNIGLIQLSDKISGTPFTEEDEVLLVELANMASATLEHVELLERERVERDTAERRGRELATLERVGARVSESLDVDDVLESVAAVLIPQLADFVAVHLARGESLEMALLRHVDPSRESVLTEINNRFGLREDAPVGIPEALRTGRPQLLSDIDDVLLEALATSPDHLDAIQGLARTALIAPMIARGQVIGTLAMGREAGAAYTKDDLDLAEEVAGRVALALDNARAVGDLQRARDDIARELRITQSLLDVGQAIVARTSLDEVLQQATDAVTQLTNAEFGAFFYNEVDDEGERFLLYTLSGAPREAFAGFAMPRNTDIFAPTFRGEDPVRLHDVTSDPRFGKNHPHLGLPEGHLPVRSYLAVSVVLTDGEVAGGLFFGHPEPGRFTPDDERIAVGIAAQAAVAIDHARLYRALQTEIEERQAAYEEQARIANVLQHSLLPPEMPDVPGVDVQASFRAGTEGVGGDFYDVFPVAGDRWAVLIGDVCGKGAEAAAVTALARHGLRAAALMRRPVGEALEVLNQMLLSSQGGQRFCTAALGYLEPDQGGLNVQLAGAGHPAPMIRRADGTVEAVAARGTLLGIFDSIELTPRQAHLEPGDLLVLYTDGVTETRDGSGRLFGEAGLRRAIAGSGGTASDMIEAISTAVDSHGESADDRAIVVLAVR